MSRIFDPRLPPNPKSLTFNDEITKSLGRILREFDLRLSRVELYESKGIFNGTESKTQSGVVSGATLIPASGSGSTTLPENFFIVGKQLHVRLCGLFTTDAVPGNATITMKIGSTTYATTGSFSLDQSCTNKVWWWDGYITCRSTGASGTVSGNFSLIHSENNVQGTMHTQDAPVTSPVTIDTTATQTIDVQLTTTDAGTSFTCTCCTFWECF